MNEDFDPYYLWLGIPPAEQPPHHYRLLGIQLFEPNPNVIEKAADRQTLLLKSMQTGPHSVLTQQLINEVSAARVCLLNLDKKSAYDAGLQETFEPASRPSPRKRRVEPEGAPSAADLPQLTDSHTSLVSVSPGNPIGIKPDAKRRDAASKGGRATVEVIKIVLGGASGLFIAVLLLWYFAGIDLPGWAKKPLNRPSNEVAAKLVPEEKTPPTASKPKTGNVIENSIKMRFVYVPSGEFEMGSPESEKGRDQNEKRHRVRLTNGVYVAMYEVTQGEYERVMGKNPSFFSRNGKGRDSVKGLDTARFPVEQVSWEDAQEFCWKLSAMPDEAKAGRVYRLPTEAEWEYLCRAGRATPFHSGAELNGKEANVNGSVPYGATTKGPFLQRTTTVGSYAPNSFGLYDMHGNVWEWCSDWHVGYSEVAVDPSGPNSGTDRVRRGGSWWNSAGDCRSAYRAYYSPARRDSNNGFRVAYTMR